IARESNGHPYLVAELVHHVQRGAPLEPGSASLGGLTLDRVIRVHFDSLPADAQALLTAVAVAGRPLELAIARDAAKLESGPSDAVDLLRSERLVRTGGLRDQDLVECFHDR